jgi:asparagine synthase (glutamine-hydrolysing)
MGTVIAFDLLSSARGPESIIDYRHWTGNWYFHNEGIPVVSGASRSGMEWLLVGTLLGPLQPAAVVESFLERKDATILHDAGGQFWLVIRDPRRDSIEIYRDRTGVLPLVYARTDLGLLVSASVQTVLDALGPPARPNPALFDAWPLFRKTFAPDVPFAGVRSLSGEDALCVEHERATELPLPMPPPPPAQYRTMAGAAAALGEALSNAVKRRVTRPGRLGALLSGGTDSSLVVALTREHFSGPLRTLFVTFDDNPRDYGRDAEEVARRFSTDHDSVRVTPESFAREWPHTVKKLASPVPMPCHVGFGIAMKHLAGSVDTMVDGDGADTVFGSSLWPQGLALSALGTVIPSRLRRRIGEWSLQFGSSSTQRLVATGLQALGTPLGRYPHVWAAMIDEMTHRRVFAQGSWAAGIERRRGFTTGGRFGDGLFSYLMLHGIPEDIATVVRLGMDEGMLFTYPFLDYEVLRASQRLPFRLRYHYRHRKLPLRTFARRYFSHDFLFKPKEGFGVPLGKWFGRKCFTPVLGLALEERSTRRGWWREREAREVMRQHMAGEGNDSSAEALPWIIANMELWARICLEGDDPALYR